MTRAFALALNSIATLKLHHSARDKYDLRLTYKIYSIVLLTNRQENTHTYCSHVVHIRMKLVMKGQFQFPLRMLMRKCGYVEKPGKGQTSYVNAFGAGGYPRFHAYVDTLDDGYVVKLHLDQKKPSYGSHTAHSGEYEGPVVLKEIERIKKWLEHLRT